MTVLFTSFLQRLVLQHTIYVNVIVADKNWLMRMGIKIFSINLAKDLKIVFSKVSKFWKPVSRNLHPASTIQSSWFRTQSPILESRCQELHFTFKFSILKAFKCKQNNFFRKFQQTHFWKNLIAKKMYAVWLRDKSSTDFSFNSYTTLIEKHSV